MTRDITATHETNTKLFIYVHFAQWADSNWAIGFYTDFTNFTNFASSPWNARALHAESKFDGIYFRNFYNIIRAHHKIAINHMRGVHELKSFYVLFPHRKEPLSRSPSAVNG